MSRDRDTDRLMKIQVWPNSASWKEAQAAERKLRGADPHTQLPLSSWELFSQKKVWKNRSLEKKKNCIGRGKDMVIQRVFFISNYHDLSWTCPKTSREERVLTLTWGHGSLGRWMHNCSRKDHLTSQEWRVTVHRARISPVGYLLFCF